ncbi:hypothetical protein [Paenisporosarcina sp. TG20]|uniref:hypothetical protein n=1 Tax=Paenisporosarcina sp. TG20 TaxID=1211706 RepID=UPI00035F0308
MILRGILELIRITAIFMILGGIMGGLAKLIYAILGLNLNNTNGAWLVGISIIVLLFVLYKNKLQFSGFLKEGGQVKLSNTLSVFLISGSVLMLIFAPFFK